MTITAVGDEQPPQPCPGRCGRPTTANTYACRWCWYRLPPTYRTQLTNSRLRPYSAAYRNATQAAADWWTRHPYTRPRPACEPTSQANNATP